MELVLKNGEVAIGYDSYSVAARNPVVAWATRTGGQRFASQATATATGILADAVVDSAIATTTAIGTDPATPV